MSKQDLEKIGAEVNLHTADAEVHLLKAEEGLVGHEGKNEKEIIQEELDNRTSDSHVSNHKKHHAEGPTLEIDQGLVDISQPTAENSLIHNEANMHQFPTDSQNEIQTTTGEEDGIIVESAQKQKDTQENVEQNTNSVKIVDSETNKSRNDADVKTNEAVSTTGESSNTQQNNPSEQPIKEPYEQPVLDERQQELVKNMAPEDRDKYLRTMSMIQKSKNETQKTLDRLDVTMTQLKKTQEDLKKTSDKFKMFNQGMEDVIRGAVNKIANALGPYSGLGNSYSEEDHFSSVPEISDVDTVADQIITKSNIIIFTGPGISTGSGVPDFKVEQPTWTLKSIRLYHAAEYKANFSIDGQDKIDVDDLLNKKFFDEKPEEVWRWHHQFRKMVTNSAPNDGHYSLADMQTQCKELGINFTLITQNIDSFHVDAYIRSDSKSKKNYFEETKGGGMIMDQDSAEYGFCKDVYEINGNINYMRCARDCCQKLFPSPLGCPEYFVPQCLECKGEARPHTKFNDEDYDDYFHKSSVVQDKIADCDCVIVIGSRLETNFASTLVSQAMSSGALIVEISSFPVLEFGNVKQLIGFTEELVPMLCTEIRERLMKFTPLTDQA